MLVLCGAGLACAADAPLGHDQAVQAAREGRYGEAIGALQRLGAAGDLQARVDLVVVLGWAGRPQDAIDAFERLQADGHAAAVPAYAQRAAAAAYHSQRRSAEAETLARSVLERYPGDAEAARLLAGVLVDSGRGLDAVAWLQQQIARQPRDAEHWIALGNAARAVPDPYLALRAYLQAQQLEPGRRDAAEAAAAVLQGLGGPHGAALQYSAPWGVAAAAPEAVPLALRVAQAGRQVRWATQLEPPSPARRFEATDRALAAIDHLLAEHAATPGADPALRTALRFDQIVALRHRERWADVLAAADALRAEGLAVPAFVRQPEADALLALRRPGQARAVYDEVLRADPDNRDAAIGRVFAALEAEDLAAAIAGADALAARESPARRLPRDPMPRPNVDWLDAHLLAAQIRSFADLQAEAWARLQPLADGAPAQAWLRAARAGMAAACGWPRLADEEIRIAASLAPEDTGIRVDVADSAMRRQRWAEARARIAELQADLPEHRGVQRVARELERHDRAEVDAGVSLRREDGQASAAPGSGVDAHVRLLSAPYAEHWRAVVAAERQSAEPDEGLALRLRYGLGASYRGADSQFDALAWTNRGALHKGGVSASGAWMPDDHWWLGAEAETFARDTPLRALLYGISADAAALSATYRWHESSAVSAGARALDFSDGNQRRSLSLSGVQRLLTVPRFTLDARPGFYTSSNSRLGGPYFNPARDRSVSLDLEAEHLTWRRYERSFSQQFGVTLGSYWQRGYGAGAVGGLRYQHRWRDSPFTEWRYGIEFNQSRYDGIAERSGVVFFNLNQRF